MPYTFNSLLENQDSFDFIWHSGDFGYADQWQSEEVNGIIPVVPGAEAYTNIMNAYYDQFVNVTKNTAYMVGPGNHEAQCLETMSYTCPVGQTNFTGYLNHFRMPTENQQNGFYQNMWYSWDYGMVHFVQLNTETDFTGAPDELNGGSGNNAGPFGFPNQQINWLDADLAAVDRKKTPWVVVSGHRPFYSAASGSLCVTCREAFESVILKHKVDLVWHGHVHYYERDAPIANGNPDPKGLNNPSSPWYITNGAAGNIEGHSTANAPWPNYTVEVNQANFGWSKLTFHNSSYITEQFISSQTNDVLDEATLYKDHGLNW